MDGERFTVEPFYRKAQRGPNNTVQDGWRVRDLLTGAWTHVELKRDAARWIERTVKNEQEILAREPAWYEADFERRSYTGLVEVYLYTAHGTRLGHVLVSQDNGTTRMKDWLREHGLKGVRRGEPK